jgi:DNA polymerase-1
MSMFGGTEVSVEEETLQEHRVLDTVNTVIHEYHTINTPALINSLITYLDKQEEFCFDTETTSLEAIEAKLVGIAFSYYKGEAYYIPFPEDQSETQRIVDLLKPVLENENIMKIGQNLKYDIMVLEKYGVKVKGPIFDTMLAHYLIEPEMRHNMDVLAENYLNYSPISIETLIGKKGSKQKSMKDAPLDKITEYAAEDADVTLRLKEILDPILKEQKAEKLFWEVETPLIQVLADVECAGVKIDTEALKEFSKELEVDIREIEKLIYEEAGTQFNIAFR